MHWVTNPSLWIASMFLIVAIRYAICYAPSIEALILLGGAVIGHGVAVWTEFKIGNNGLRRFTQPVVVNIWVILLVLASVWIPNSSNIFKYHGHFRWTGPWNDPNIFGMLMGVGVLLATGLLTGMKKEEGRMKNSGERQTKWKAERGNKVCVLLCLLAVVLMGRGLLHSYSRGAWVATECGLAYLIGSWLWRLGEGGGKAESGKRKAETEHITLAFQQTIISSQQPSTGLQPPSPAPASEGHPSGGGEGVFLSCVSWLKRNWLPLVVVLVAVGVNCFWNFRQMDWHPVRRALSVVNSADFSSRNRVVAWEGALQMTGEHPWFGVGWNQPEPLYENYYLPPKLTESAAIEMNDYLMLGATLGIPALFCFGMYLWLSLIQNSKFKIQNGKAQENDWLQTTCRAGAIVLLVGFWFDGGLFKLATASTFWILLELGANDLRQQKVTEETKVHPIVA